MFFDLKKKISYKEWIYDDAVFRILQDFCES